MAVQRHFSLRAHLVGDDVAQSVSRLFAGLEALFLHAVAEGVHQLHGDVAPTSARMSCSSSSS